MYCIVRIFITIINLVEAVVGVVVVVVIVVIVVVVQISVLGGVQECIFVLAFFV